MSLFNDLYILQANDELYEDDYIEDYDEEEDEIDRDLSDFEYEALECAVRGLRMTTAQTRLVRYLIQDELLTQREIRLIETNSAWLFDD